MLCNRPSEKILLLLKEPQYIFPFPVDKCQYHFSASASETAVARGLMFPGCRLLVHTHTSHHWEPNIRLLSLFYTFFCSKVRGKYNHSKHNIGYNSRVNARILTKFHTNV